MFGIKKKKKESSYTANGVKKIKVSSLPPKEQKRVLALLQEMGDQIEAHYQEIMERRLERARAVVDERINNPGNGDDK